MAKNNVRTSSEMATIAAHTLSGDFDTAYVEMLARVLLSGANAYRIERDAWIEELAQSLAGSVLSNRRA